MICVFILDLAVTNVNYVDYTTLPSKNRAARDIRVDGMSFRILTRPTAWHVSQCSCCVMSISKLCALFVYTALSPI